MKKKEPDTFKKTWPKITARDEKTSRGIARIAGTVLEALSKHDDCDDICVMRPLSNGRDGVEIIGIIPVRAIKALAASALTQAADKK